MIPVAFDLTTHAYTHRFMQETSFRHWVKVYISCDENYLRVFKKVLTRRVKGPLLCLFATLPTDVTAFFVNIKF